MAEEDIATLGIDVDSNADDAAQSLQRLEKAAEGAWRRISGLETATSKAAKTNEGAVGAAQKLADRQRKLDETATNAAASMGKLGIAAVAFGSLIGGLVGGAIESMIRGLGRMIRQIIDVADAWGTYRARIDVATKATFDSATVFANLRQQALTTGGSVEGFVELFQSLARQRGQLRANNEELTQFIGLIEKIGAIGGSSVEATQRAMFQLQQAISLGRLQGQDLRSIMTNMPELAFRLAQGLGVSVGKLRELGEQGKLTSEVVFRALMSQGAEINRDFEKAGSSVGRSWSNLTTSIGSLIDVVNQKLSATVILAEALNLAARGIAAYADLIRPETRFEIATREGQREIGQVQRGVGQRQLTRDQQGNFTYTTRAVPTRGITATDRMRDAEEDDIQQAIRRAGTLAIETSDAQAEAANTVVRAVNPQIAKYEELTQQQRILNEAIRAGTGDTASYEKALNQLNQQILELQSPLTKFYQKVSEQLVINFEPDQFSRRVKALLLQEEQARARGPEAGTPVAASVISSVAQAEFIQAAQQQALALDAQTASTRRMAAATLEGGDAMRRASAEAKIAAYASTTFGKSAGDNTKAIQIYTAAVYRQLDAENQLARAQIIRATQGLQQEADASLKLASAIEQGTEAMQRQTVENQLALFVERELGGEWAKNTAIIEARRKALEDSVGAENRLTQARARRRDIEQIEDTRSLVAAASQSRIEFDPSQQQFRLVETQLRIQAHVNRLVREQVKPEEAIRTATELVKAEEELARVTDEQRQKVQNLNAVAVDFSRIIGTAFEDALVEGGKFSDLVKALEKDLIRLGTRVLVTKPLENFLTSQFQTGPVTGGNWFESIFGSLPSLFGAGAAAAGGGTNLAASALPEAFQWAAAFLHQGGIVEHAPRRQVPARSFAFAPRYHSGGMAGFAPDEMPAVLRRREEVITEDDWRHRNNQPSQGGMASRPISVSVTVNTPDANSFRQAEGNIGATIARRMQRDLQRNG